MADIDDIPDPQLEALLRNSFEGPVADAGFTDRVMRALPPRREPRRWLVPMSAVAGGVLAWLALMPSPLWREVAREWIGGQFGAASVGVAVLALVVALASCACSLEER